MEKLRRLSVCLLLVLFTITIAACGKDSTGQVGENREVSGNAGLITVGYAQSGTGAAWSLANVESIQQNCTEENGIKLIYEVANDDFDTQIEIVR